MASYMRMIGGKNGKKVSVSGKTRNTIKKETFDRVCNEKNGDVEEIAKQLGITPGAVKSRYPNRIKKGAKIPPMTNFTPTRKHVEMTPQLQQKLVREWNRLEGDSEKVAQSIGVSSATVYGWIKKFDKMAFDANVELRAKKDNEDWDELTFEEKTIARQEAEEKILEEGTFVSMLCEKKKKTRGKKSAEIDQNLISDMFSFIEEELEKEEDEEENDESEENPQEKLLEEVMGIVNYED